MKRETIWESKTPVEIVDYGFDWTEDVGTDVIVSSDFVLLEGDVVLGLENQVASVVSVRVSGGSAGSTSKIVNRVILASGQKWEAVAWLTVRNV